MAIGAIYHSRAVYAINEHSTQNIDKRLSSIHIFHTIWVCVCLNHYSECLKIGISEEYIVIESGASKCQLEMNIKTWPPLGYDSHINQS